MVLFYAAIIIITNHLILAFVLFFNPRLANLHNRLLAFLLTAIAFIHTIIFFICWKMTVAYQHVVGLEYVFGAMVGPFIYLYIKSFLTKPNFRFSAVGPHFIVSFLFLLFYLYGQMNETLSYSLALIGEKPYRVFVYTSDLVVNVSIISYIILSIAMYRRAKAHNDIKKVYHAWLRTFFRTTIIVAVVGLPLGFVANGQYTAVYTVFVTFIYFLVLMWQFASTSRTFANEPKSSGHNGADQQEFSVIHQYFIQQKPYINQDLTLEMLAEKLELPKNHLSKLINNHLNMNFFELVNSYRVEDAKFKLLDREFQHYTIDAIAKESGFKSRTSFYEAFKKQTGMTPTEFRLNNIAHKN